MIPQMGMSQNPWNLFVNPGCSLPAVRRNHGSPPSWEKSQGGCWSYWLRVGTFSAGKRYENITCFVGEIPPNHHFCWWKSPFWLLKPTQSAICGGESTLSHRCPWSAAFTPSGFRMLWATVMGWSFVQKNHRVSTSMFVYPSLQCCMHTHITFR